MAAMSRNEATQLFEILDEVFGVFRQSEMNDRAQEFYDSKREEFIESYSTEIPASFWFQGVGCPSASLDFDSSGFNISLNHLSLHRQTEASRDVANEKIKNSGFIIV